VEQLFATEEKTLSPVRSSKSGVYYVVRTDAVIPEKLQPLAEVRAQVEKAVLQRMRREKLNELAKTISTGFADPSQREGLIRQHKLKSAAFGPLTRQTEPSPLPQQVHDQIFDLRPGESTGMVENQLGDGVIAVLGAIKPNTATPDNAELESLRLAIAKSTADEMSREYIRYLREKYQVTIDQAALSSLRQAP